MPNMPPGMMAKAKKAIADQHKSMTSRVRTRGNVRCYVSRAGGSICEIEIGQSAPPGVEVFDSKLEARCWLELCRVFGAENIKRQASFRLQCGRRIVPDFMILRAGAAPVLLDAKGRMEKDWAVKKDVFEREYGWEILLLRHEREVLKLKGLA